MKGTILGYMEEKGSGAISGEDGNRYKFITSEFMGEGAPVVGCEVDFEVSDGDAKGIYPLAAPNPSTAQSHSAANAGNDQKQSIFIGYVLLGIGLFTGLFWILGGIWAFIKKSETNNSVEQSHYANMISVCLWGIGLSVLGMFTLVFIIGWFILIGTWLWAAYRILMGISKLSANNPV